MESWSRKATCLISLLFPEAESESSLKATVIVQPKEMRRGPQGEGEKGANLNGFRSRTAQALYYLRAGAKETGGFSNRFQALDGSYSVTATPCPNGTTWERTRLFVCLLCVVGTGLVPC